MFYLESLFLSSLSFQHFKMFHGSSHFNPIVNFNYRVSVLHAIVAYIIVSEHYFVGPIMPLFLLLRIVSLFASLYPCNCMWKSYHKFLAFPRSRWVTVKTQPLIRHVRACTANLFYGIDFTICSRMVGLFLGEIGPKCLSPQFWPKCPLMVLFFCRFHG